MDQTAQTGFSLDTRENVLSVRIIEQSGRAVWGSIKPFSLNIFKKQISTWAEVGEASL